MDEDDEDKETLQEFERRKEELMEQFLELAYAKKHEAIEELKAECKAKKVNKETEKKTLAEMTKLMDLKRKEGLADIKKKLNQIIMSESMSVMTKLERLNDAEEIKEYMNQCLAIAKQTEDNIQSS